MIPLIIALFVLVNSLGDSLSVKLTFDTIGFTAPVDGTQPDNEAASRNKVMTIFMLRQNVGVTCIGPALAVHQLN